MPFARDSGEETAGQMSPKRQIHGTTATHDFSGQRQGVLGPRSGEGGDGPHSPRELPPLQVSEAKSAAARNGPYSNSRSPKSPTEMRTTSDSRYSPRSPRSNLVANLGQPRSPRERPEEPLISGDASVNGNTSGIDPLSVRKATASPPKAHSYSQLRNVSSPFPESTPAGQSSPPSPGPTHSSPPPFTGFRPEVHPMPRTSSIDSAISTISLGNVNSQRPSQDSITTGMPDMSHLIQTAGSPEAVIQHLLKEKQHSAAQNAQLWKLVDKQRTLVLGLNQDLERALKDKEKYRKKLREHLERIPPVPTSAPKATGSQARAASRSPAPSEASADLPIQRQSLERNIHADPPSTALSDVSGVHAVDEEEAPLSGNVTTTHDGSKDNWVRSKTRVMGPKHAHKSTSSSDVGVFGPTRIVPSVAPIQTNDMVPSSQKEVLESPSQTSPSIRPVVSPTTSFTAKRSQPFSAKAFNGPTLALIESTPPGNDVERMTPPRKAPPAPLDLAQPKRDTPTQVQFGPEDHSGSDYDEDMEADELPAFERGRKKTREDDDREREAALLKEKQDRSRSLREKSSKSRTSSGKPKSQDNGKNVLPQNVPIPSSIKAFSPDLTPASASGFLSPPTSLAGVLSPADTRIGSSTTERIVPMTPMSPGLPLSPRPNHRPLNPPTPRLPRDVAGPSAVSPPLSPRNGFVGLPLSPRAPRQPIPLPPHTPISLASPKPPNLEFRKDDGGSTLDPPSPLKSPIPYQQTQADKPPPIYSTEIPPSRGVFKGFMSDAYPDLLLPPNALPSIHVKVVSSRLKPSRHSLVIKGSDEEPVFTLGVSARSDRQGLWQVEKPIQSLQQLDQQLRQSSMISVKQPDRSLFSGHAPAKIDARRIALENYFETLLDTPMDEKTALTLCYYLSSQVSEPRSEEANGIVAAPHSGSPTTQGPDGRLLKEGYLTKRGKNFGGWKARYFVLDEPVLRYYETPGGSLLGTIKLHGAQIGKQNASSSHSPSKGEDGDSLYRHAFVICEPKRKDSSSFMDHVLCAESDAERDSWVAALLCYVEIPGGDNNSRPLLSKTDSGSRKVVILAKKNSLRREAASADSPESETFDSLQAVPYENTQVAQAPLVQITPDPRPAESPSPTTSGSQPSVRASSAQSKAISAPQNGAKISDVGAWGNKPMALTINHPKEQKKRSIWGFRDKNGPELGVNHSDDSNLSLTQQQYQEQITNVKAAFGIPLAEAVEYCGPRGIDACLPAVVYRCLEYLEMKDAASEEGIFRMSGSNTLIKGLRSRFNAEGDLDLLGDDEPYYDVHAVASLLKLYLRELPQPVLTRELHLGFLSVLGK